MTLSNQLDAASSSHKSKTKSNSQQKTATSPPKDGIKSGTSSKQSKSSGTSDKKDVLSRSQESLLRRTFSIRKQLSNLVTSGGSSLRRSLSFGKGLNELAFRNPWSASLHSLREDVPSTEEDAPALRPDGRANGPTAFDSRKLVTRTQSLLVQGTRTDAKKQKVSYYSWLFSQSPPPTLCSSYCFLLYITANFIKSKIYSFVTICHITITIQYIIHRPVFGTIVSSGKLRPVALVRTDVSEELSATFIRVTRIGELVTTLAVTSNRRTLRRNTKSPCHPDEGGADFPRNVGSYKSHTAQHPRRHQSS
jgi:hypothetical protein